MIQNAPTTEITRRTQNLYPGDMIVEEIYVQSNGRLEKARRVIVVRSVSRPRPIPYRGRIRELRDIDGIDPNMIDPDDPTQPRRVRLATTSYQRWNVIV